MKHLSFFGVTLVAIILLALGVLFLNYSRWVPTRSATTNTTISQTLSESQLVASSTLVTAISADVFSKPSDEAMYTPLKDASQVAGGGSVKTSATGRALLEGKNTTILDTNSEIKLAVFDPEKNQTRLQLEAGQVWSRVKKLSDKGEFYEIETQNARASVRGTSFGLKKSDLTLTLYVVDGTVRFGAISPQESDTSSYSVVDVTAGKKAVLHEGDLAPVVSDITDVDKREAWYLYNNPASKQQTQAVENNPSDTTATSQTAQPSSIASPKSESKQTPAGSEPVSTPIPRSSSTSTSEPTTTPSSSTTQQKSTITPMTDSTAELLLSSSSPSSIRASAGGTITLSGVGFVKANVIFVFIGNTRITNFRAVSDTKLEIAIGVRQLSAGTYDVSVEGSQGEYASLSPGLTVNP